MHRLLAIAAVALAGPAPAAEFTVGIGPGFNYNPSHPTIEAGDSVRFSASFNHPLRSDDQLFGCDQDCTVAFPQPGEFPFYCDNHGGPGGFGMSGVVRVLPSSRIHADGFEG
jgi:plastocyanin